MSLSPVANAIQKALSGNYASQYLLNNSSTLVNIPNKHECFHALSWMRSEHQPRWLRDCESAFHRLQTLAVQNPFEKLIFGRVRMHPVVYLPKLFASGSCEIAVMMLVDFPREGTRSRAVLPAPDLFPYPQQNYEMATWTEIWTASTTVLNLCILFDYQEPMVPKGGYAQIGNSGQIGVLFFATGSRLYEALRVLYTETWNQTLNGPDASI
ncbi:MAG: hypothetical protein LQ342_007138 [Letrouitia transgressa]|nr:MAG: hypothetical protein LQ342_007138 [Letrouitia transgressa]